MKKAFLVATFAVYLAVVATLTILPARLSRLRGSHADHVNLVPFSYSINCIMLAHRKHPDLMTFCLRNTLGNIALFMPFGILLPLVTSRVRSFKRVTLLAMCLSLTIETIQFISRFIGSPRAVDIDDVLLNTLGACVGFLIYRYLIGGKRGRGRG